jgi:hypothetical protein
VYRSKSALGDTEGASAAQKWAGQVDTAIGGIGSRPQSDVRNTLETYKANLNKPVTPYSFDINNNQQYQQALQAAQRSAQTAGNNATVALGARGIGNSQQAMTTSNQIQQRSVADVNANMLPQIMQQDYARYRDQQNMEMAQNDNLLKYANALNGLDQQDLDNKFRADQASEQKKQSNIDLAKWGQSMYGFGSPKEDAGVFFDQYKGAKTLPVQQYEASRADAKFDQNYKLDSLDHSRYVDGRQLDISQQNADVNSANSAWNMSNDNPDNQYKSAEVTKLKAEAAQVGKGKPLTTEDAIALLNRSSFVSEDGAVNEFGEFQKNGKTKIDKTGMIQAIAGLGVTDDQMDALFNYYGISQKEIQSFEASLRGN